MDLYTRDWLIEQGYPFGKAAEGIPKGDPAVEHRRTDPDRVVFHPDGREKYVGDNEHLMVFRAGREEGLLAVWTQSSCEGTGDNHIVISRSRDGRTWDTPRYVTGARDGEPHGRGQASWAFPIVSRGGRLYLFYLRQLSIWDNGHNGSGGLGCMFSDDDGRTWSGETLLPMARSRHDNPDPRYPKNWIVWQKPIRDGKEKHIAGYTLCTSRAHRIVDPVPDRWVNQDSRCYFMRFENIDEEPDPADLRITWLPDGDMGIEVENGMLPFMSTAQEPALALLPDGGLFCLMRTMTGSVQYSVSKDDGRHWSTALPLRYRDDGDVMPHPMSPCPIYGLERGLFLLAFHNNPGERLGFSQWKEKWDDNEANFFRNPLFLAVGRHHPEARQPIWFGRPHNFLDTADIAVGPKRTAETGTYTSLTEYGGETVFWYPDRKYYLLGKRIPPSLL